MKKLYQRKKEAVDRLADAVEKGRIINDRVFSKYIMEEFDAVCRAGREEFKEQVLPWAFEVYDRRNRREMYTNMGENLLDIIYKAAGLRNPKRIGRYLKELAKKLGQGDMEELEEPEPGKVTRN